MFSNEKSHIEVRTAGEAAAELARLDPGMPVRAPFCDSVDIVVFNRGCVDEHVAFEDGGDWDNED